MKPQLSVTSLPQADKKNSVLLIISSENANAQTDNRARNYKIQNINSDRQQEIYQ